MCTGAGTMTKLLFGETLGINREKIQNAPVPLSDASAAINQPAQKLSNTGAERINRPKKRTVWGS
jgi:hypothetical protein